MKAMRIILILLLDIIFLGAFVVCLPVLVEVLSNRLAAILFAGAMIAGGGIVVGMGVFKCRRHEIK